MEQSVERIMKILDAEIDINKSMEENAFYAKVHARDAGDEDEVSRQSALMMCYVERIDALYRLKNQILQAGESEPGEAV